KDVVGEALGPLLPERDERFDDPRLLLRAQSLEIAKERIVSFGIGDVREEAARALQEAVERVVVVLRDRIELVVVAANAAEREPLERSAEDVERARHAVRLFATDVDRRMGGLAEMPEACALRRLVRAKARI